MDFLFFPEEHQTQSISRQKSFNKEPCPFPSELRRSPLQSGEQVAGRARCRMGSGTLRRRGLFLSCVGCAGLLLVLYNHLSMNMRARTSVGRMRDDARDRARRRAGMTSNGWLSIQGIPDNASATFGTAARGRAREEHTAQVPASACVPTAPLTVVVVSRSAARERKLTQECEHSPTAVCPMCLWRTSGRSI